MHFGILIAGGDMLVQYVTQMFTILFSMHLVFCLSVRYDKYLFHFVSKRKLDIGRPDIVHIFVFNAPYVLLMGQI